MNEEKKQEIEMVEVSFNDIMQKIDAWIEQLEKIGIKPAGGIIPLGMAYKGYKLGIHLEAIDQENTTKAS